jgi:ubiquinone/menaquinone biosynthesis C-methylase UbiE
MSLTGRRIIDQIKQKIGRYVRLPVPPYGSPEYWEMAYKSLTKDDSMEWGDISLPDILRYQYRLVQYQPANLGPSVVGEDLLETTLADQIQVQPGEPNAPILILGCGNSKFGEELVDAGYSSIIQTDVSKRVVASLSERCAHSIPSEKMTIIQDDATELSAFHSQTMNVVIDKGLMDALFCADEHEQCGEVLSAVQRVLKPGGVFFNFSFSQPEYLLPAIHQQTKTKRLRPMALEIQQLDRILLYKYTMKDAGGNSNDHSSVSVRHRQKRGGRKKKS